MNEPDNKKNLRRALPFVVEFAKFSTGFVAIVSAALIALHIAQASTF